MNVFEAAAARLDGSSRWLSVNDTTFTEMLRVGVEMFGIDEVVALLCQAGRDNGLVDDALGDELRRLISEQINGEP